MDLKLFFYLQTNVIFSSLAVTELKASKWVPNMANLSDKWSYSKNTEGLKLIFHFQTCYFHSL